MQAQMFLGPGIDQVFQTFLGLLRKSDVGLLSVMFYIFLHGKPGRSFPRSQSYSKDNVCCLGFWEHF